MQKINLEKKIKMKVYKIYHLLSIICNALAIAYFVSRLYFAGMFLVFCCWLFDDLGNKQEKKNE
jgi:uncharacterized membrane protein